MDGQKMKYDNMVIRNRAVSREKVRLAKTAIGELLRANEAVTVAVLVRKTGLSREFFYKNEEARTCLAKAREEQRGQVFQRPQKALFDRAMAAELERAKKQLLKERKDRERLQEEVKKLQTALKRKDIDLLRKL